MQGLTLTLLAYENNLLKSLTEIYEQLKQESLPYGLIINIQKTKYLRCMRSRSNLDNLLIHDEQIEQINSFKYLGTIVNDNNSIEEEINLPHTSRCTCTPNKLMLPYNCCKESWRLHDIVYNTLWRICS